MEHNQDQCAKVKVYAIYYDMYSQSRAKLASTIICSNNYRPTNPNLQFLIAKRSIRDEAINFSSQYYDEAGKYESLPIVRYVLHNIPSKIYIPEKN